MHSTDAMTEMYRTGRKIQPNIGNKLTQARIKQYEQIKEATGEDPNGELDYSMQIIEHNVPQIQRYVMSQNEAPSDKTTDLVKQAYNLRCAEISALAQSMDVPENEAQVWLEMDESDSIDLETSAADNFLGSVFAAIGIADSRLKQRAKKKGLAYDPSYSMSEKPDNLDPNLVTGVLNTIGTKISSSDLLRAAQGKPAGVLGFLGTGGTAHYNALRTYFKQNPTIAKQVISGQITDESQLPNWRSNLPSGANAINSNDLTSAIANYQMRSKLQQFLPFILIGIAVIVIIVLVARHKK